MGGAQLNISFMVEAPGAPTTPNPAALLCTGRPQGARTPSGARLCTGLRPLHHAVCGVGGPQGQW